MVQEYSDTRNYQSSLQVRKNPNNNRSVDQYKPLSLSYQLKASASIEEFRTIYRNHTELKPAEPIPQIVKRVMS